MFVLAFASAMGVFAGESVLPQAVAEKSQQTEFNVNVCPAWTRNLLGDDYGRYVGWPTVTRLKSGELVAVFSGDREGHVCPYGKVMLIRSKDQGETWTKPVVVCDGPIDDRDAGLLELENGDLVLFWFTSLAFIEYKSYYEKHPEYLEIGRKVPDDLKRRALGSWARRSTDGGRTWSEPVRVPVMTPHGGRQLRDGRILVIGKHNSQAIGILSTDKPQAPSYFAAVESTDGGRSFHEIGRIEHQGIRDHWSFAEPSFVEAADGTLTAYFRYELPPDGKWSNERVYPRLMCRSVSTDGGRTWTNMERAELDGFPPHFLELGGDRVLCTYGSRTPGRTGIYASLSTDGGKSFDVAHEFCIYRTPFEDCGYPSTVKLDDGSFLTVFYAYPRRGVPAALTGVKWRPNEERWESFPIYGGGYVQNVILTRNPNVAYMTIDVGGPYRSDDGCKTWRPLHGYMSFDLKLKQLDHARSLSVDPRDENNIVCASGNNPENMGGIVVSRDGGRTWKQTAVGNYLSNGRRRWMGQLLSRNPWNPDELVTGGDCTGLMKSTDNGETWRPVGLDDHWFSHIHYDRAVKGRIWACAPGYEDVPEEAAMVKAGKEPNPKPRYGRQRGLYRSDDGGETWTSVAVSRVPEELCQIAGDVRVLGVFDEQEVRATEDGGRTWVPYSQGLERLAPGKKIGDDYGCQRGRYKGIGAGPDFYLIVDTRGNVQRRGRKDERWSAVKANPIVYSEPEKEMRTYDHMPAACTIVISPHDPKKWYVTDWYSVWETEDAGLNWHSRIHGAQQLVPFTIAASPFDSKTVFYATADSRMYVSHDGTRSFVKTTGEGNLGESVNSVAFSRVTPGLVMVTGGKFNPCLRLSRDDGRTWTLCATNGLPPIKPDNGWTKQDGFYAPYAVAVHPKGDIFYAVFGGVIGKGKAGIYVTEDLGASWKWFGEGLPEGANLFKFMEWGNGEAFAVSESGDMLCWDQGGESVFRRGPNDAAWQKVDFSMRVIDPVSGRGVQASACAVPGKPGWFMANCGNGRGALFRSTDGGRTWTKMVGVTGMFGPLAFDAHTPGLLVAAGSGTVYVSHDYGAHFSTLPGGFDFPSGVFAQFYVDRGRIWATGSGSGAWTYRGDLSGLVE